MALTKITARMRKNACNYINNHKNNHNTNTTTNTTGMPSLVMIRHILCIIGTTIGKDTIN